MFLYLFTDNLIASDVAGKVVSVTGSVLVRKDTKSGPSGLHKVQSGSEIHAGEVINTSNDGSVRLLMSDQTIVDLTGSSLFKVNEYRLNHGSDRKVDLTLGYGKVRTSVTQPVGAGGKFTMHTKTATMGVRGTEFIVQSDIGELKTQSQVKTQITVSHGKVEVSTPSSLRGQSSKPLILTNGQQLTTTTFRPEVKTLEVAQITQALQTSRIEDHTFTQTVSISPDSAAGGTGGLANLSLPAMEASAINLPPPQNSGLPGAFAAQIYPTSAALLPPGSPATVKVTFNK